MEFSIFHRCLLKPWEAAFHFTEEKGAGTRWLPEMLPKHVRCATHQPAYTPSFLGEAGSQSLSTEALLKQILSACSYLRSGVHTGPGRRWVIKLVPIALLLTPTPKKKHGLWASILK